MERFVDSSINLEQILLKLNINWPLCLFHKIPNALFLLEHVSSSGNVHTLHTFVKQKLNVTTSGSSWPTEMLYNGQNPWLSNCKEI